MKVFCEAIDQLESCSQEQNPRPPANVLKFQIHLVTKEFAWLHFTNIAKQSSGLAIMLQHIVYYYADVCHYLTYSYVHLRTFGHKK
jgi:hypothetical protein